MKKLTNKEFILRANNIHNHKYDYSKVNYKNTKTKVKIICKKHGEFLQIPKSHLCGNGCLKCGNNIPTIEEFIEKANNIHNFKYNYSKVKYINNKTKVIIICPKHGKFKQRPANHLNGQGCLECGHSRKSTTKEFIKKVKKIHGDQYDYSKVNYINNSTKIVIICRKHGEFLQQPNKHLNGQKCIICSGKKINNYEFIRKAKEIHKNKYDYFKTNYKNSKIKVIIICEKHGEFLQNPIDHLRGRGCAKCFFKNNTLSTKEFIKKANNVHNFRYNYSKTIYKNWKTKVIIICKKHGGFLQTPNSHLNNNNCPKCSSRISKSANKWLNKIEKNNNIILKKEFPLNISGQQFFIDGFDAQTNTCYEYNGYFWHGHPDYYGPNDINPRTKTTFGELYRKTLEKEKQIKSAGYNLITKWGN